MALFNGVIAVYRENRTKFQPKCRFVKKCGSHLRNSLFTVRQIAPVIVGQDAEDFVSKL
jgi:hypothetical protein